MDRFLYQLTCFGSKSSSKFAERQLKKYGLKNDLDYAWMLYNKGRHKLDLWAIYTTGSTLDYKTLMDLVRRRGKESYADQKKREFHSMPGQGLLGE